MKFVKTIFAVFALTLLGATLATGARADQWNKKTVMTFSETIEIPGQILPAGTYTFVLLDSPADRHIVQIFNADGTHIIATILAINNYRLTPTGDTVVKFAERAGDNPEALKAWFYPGDNFGQEFVYPKQRALQLAAVVKEPVLALATDTDDLKTASIVAVTPEGESVRITFEAPQELSRYIAPKGSVALDGVSLTVNAVPAPGRIQVALIPYTREQTTLGALAPGDRVQVEGDLIGKVVRQLVAERGASGAA